ncbi:MAG: hypothetical protein J7K39_01995 [Bacteroidales bacterium]|nr:hypothetical protein [Bacteroidales bacterium]
MRTAEYHIEEFKNVFENSIFFHVSDIYAFYQSFDAKIPRTTVNWRINTLVKIGVIQRVGRGKYKLGTGNIFSPQISSKAIRLNNLMKANFPYLNFLIWHISEINSLSQHLINKDIYYVEVERDAIDAVYEKLGEKYKFVLKGTINDDVFFDESQIVVRPLVTASPLQVVKKVQTITIEKLLVDLFVDKEFEFLQGNELIHIFTNAFSKYTINTDKLLRYASRKEKRITIANYIDTIKRQ